MEWNKFQRGLTLLNKEANPRSFIFRPIHNPGFLLLVWSLLMGRKVNFCPKLGSCWVLLKTSTPQQSSDTNSLEYKSPDKTLNLFPILEMRKQLQHGLKGTAGNCFLRWLVVDRCPSALAHRRLSSILPSLASDLAGL